MSLRTVIFFNLLTVLTTDITADKSAYYSEIDDNVTISLTITSEASPKNITIQVTRPDNGVENITEIFLNQPVIYNVNDVTDGDLGKYKFAAYEIVAGQDPLLSSETEILIYSYSKCTSINLYLIARHRLIHLYPI